MKSALLFAFLFGFTAHLQAQGFGKNHVQYRRFRTYFMQSRHFDIYFTAGGEQIAEFVAETAEESYRELREDFRYELIDRITIIVYNSHNDFEQTNVQLTPGEEALGGFTEFFKNRVVIPFEGDWEKFRHVIHHELTHAVMLQMVYGSGIQAILTGLSRMQMPLWFIEGLAEYESLSWNTESDMFIRDAALNGYLPDLDHLSGFLAYKGGQSVLYTIAQNFGGQKIGEILTQIKLTGSFDAGLRNALGMGRADLSRWWHKQIKKAYWPDIAARDEPADIAERLTDHLNFKNFINNSPALSPRGDKIAFLSDRSDYFDIYLMSTVENHKLRRIVSGQTSEKLEEMHWLRPGISWSPDGRFLVFASKAGAEDALHIVDVPRRKIVRTMKFGLDGVFSPAWSPRNDEIAFVGLHRGRSDLFVVDLNTGSLRQITDDVFSDLDPAYSPDGEWLAFSSDRGAVLQPDSLPADFKIHRFDYRNRDIYLVRVRDGSHELRRITDTPFWEKFPVFSPDGRYLAFTSDRSGVANIYMHELASGREFALTNLLTGASNLSWAGDGSRLAFTAFSNGGYDIFLLKNPLQMGNQQVQPALTGFMQRIHTRRKGGRAAVTVAAEHEDRSDDKYRHYIYGDDFARGLLRLQDSRVAFLDTVTYKTADGRYRIRPYKPHFTPDIIYGNAGYSRFFGVQGSTQFSMSDILGNHRFDFFTDFFYDIRNTNFLLRYAHLPRRIDYSFSVFHNAFFFFSGRLGLMRDRLFGSTVFASYPISRYRRLDAGATWLAINRDFADLPDTTRCRIRVVLLRLDYVKDTAVWGWTGPINGARGRISLAYSPQYGPRALGFFTLTADYRRYLKIKKETNLVLRAAGGFSEGKHPQSFFIGGIDNWLNQRFSGGIRVDQPEDIYFSRFVTPLRGADYYEQTGTRFALVNVEFRFPMIRYLALGWPLRLRMSNIRGALFTDMGGAWRKGEPFRLFKTRGGWPMLDDLLMGYGLGARANFGFLLFRFDVAWRTDLQRTESDPRYYFSLGAEF